MNSISLGQSALRVSPICLGTMTFGEQVPEPDAHRILDHSLARGVNFLDTAEMYSVPARAETCGATETIIGNWLARNPGVRQKVVLATKASMRATCHPGEQDTEVHESAMRIELGPQAASIRSPEFQERLRWAMKH